MLRGQKTTANQRLRPTWWRRMDSNHRRQSQQIYSLSPLATWVLLHMKFRGNAKEGGAGGRIRTPDLLITNQLLYQLSYTSTSAFTTKVIITAGGGFVNSKLKKRPEKREDGVKRQEGISRRTGRSGAACAGGSSTPGTPILSWRAGWCANTAWAAMPGGTLPPSAAGWAGALTLFRRKRSTKREQ